MAVGCGGDAARSSTPAPATTSPRRVERPAEPAKRASRPRIVFLGDSLTAGLGLAQHEAYPALLQRRLEERRLDYEVVNAGVSGDTSAGGLRRLEWALDGDVRVLVVALGGNDGLRGLPPSDLARNLAAIIERATARGVRVILAGMEAPPNNGVDYTREFRAVYANLARRYKVALIPFLLQGVAGEAALNQPDGIHPNARGARLVADTVWTALELEIGAR
jgi:acyl-CoA thioesterase-1